MHALVAVLLANLPVRWWNRFEDRFPVSRMAMVSAVVISGVGLALVFEVYRGLGGWGLGVIAFYLLASGMMRAASVLADDVRGDLVLTVLDDAVRSRLSKKRALQDQHARERREGLEIPDRLVRAEALRCAGAEFVLLASRVKTDWNAGTCLLGADGVAHRIGQPFDVETPAGLRRAYPLTRMTSLEAIRHAVPYELPPLSGRS